MLSGLQDFQKVLEEAPQDARDCSSMQEDGLRMQAWAAQVHEPIKLVKSMISNTIENDGIMLPYIRDTWAELWKGEYNVAG